MNCADAHWCVLGGGGHGNPGKLTPRPESQGGVGRALGELAVQRGGRGCSTEWVEVTPWWIILSRSVVLDVWLPTVWSLSPA